MLTTNTVLFDNFTWENLLPITYTRPVADIRVGITTIREKWLSFTNTLSVKTRNYLSEKHPANIQEDNLFINSSLIPTESLVKAIGELAINEYLEKDNCLIAFRAKEYNLDKIRESGKSFSFVGEIIYIENTWDIFEKNSIVLRIDFERLTKGRKSEKISDTNKVLCSENIFIEKGAKVEFATINASGGPVYVGGDAEIMEGALIRGPFAICEHSAVKMGAKIYEDTTIGPWCKVGGEVQNSVFMGYSNKGHDGYLGNSVLGEWCNLGADTNSSNLKNNYARVKLWSYKEEKFTDTGLQFCGLVMGDHSKCGINTMFNTGTVVGVSANIFGAGFPRNFVPSFSWGGAAGFSLYTFKKAIATTKIVVARRKIELSDVDARILQEVFNMTQKYRKY